MKIANIVTTDQINVTTDFNIVDSVDKIVVGLPTLIIGWDYIKEKYPNYDILTRKIDENTFWTFKRHEKRDLQEEDIFNFVARTYENIISDIYYVCLDPFQLNRREIRKSIKKIYSFNKIITYKHDSMLYIFDENIIFGVDLMLMDFIGLDSSKILNKIKAISGSFLDKDIIFIEYKKRIEKLDDMVKYIPLLYSIEHE